MKKIILYGAGVNGKIAAETIKSKNAFEKFADLVAFADKNSDLWNIEIGGVKVISPSDIATYDYDEVVITVTHSSTEVIIEELLREFKIPREKITFNTFNTFKTIGLHFLESQSKIIYDRGVSGSVAECGVWQGDFAKYINYYFPDRKIYLFDTFKGFSESDVEIDRKNNVGCDRDTSVFFDTSAEYVRSKLPNPDKSEFRVGHFPETATGLEKETFAFVHLDMDLYQPTLDGLKFFYPLMNKGGVIVVHDYFDYYGWTGVKKAVFEFCDFYGCSPLATGDKLSCAIVKN